MSNTDTKHSEDITNSSEKSTKGEGTVETAKVKGTVSPQRPQVRDSQDRLSRSSPLTSFDRLKIKRSEIHDHDALDFQPRCSFSSF